MNTCALYDLLSRQTLVGGTFWEAVPPPSNLAMQELVAALKRAKMR